jgi:D-alanyl-D-alanine carboxypeptidase/D-alanyl-D-alanine-endopeptidase (penicillin-binding protein 4)
VPDPAALAAAVGPVLADPAVGPAVSASVVDALTGQVLFETEPATGREPASVAKLLTAAAVLHRLGPDHVVPTRAVTGAAPGEVVLVAGGDVLLSAGAGDPLAAPGRAGLADLADATAAALAGQGVTTVTVTVDDRAFAGVGTGEALGPGVSAADVSNGFVAPFTAVAVDAGRLRAGATAPRQADPGLGAAQAFADRLAERGLAVTRPPVRSAAPAGASVLGEVVSAPLAEVVGYVLATSDNTAADALARLVAVDLGRPATFAGSGAAVLEAVAALGVPTAGLRLADGSGLSDGSVLTAPALTGVLALAASPEHPELRPLYADLPVAGLTGTLGGRFEAAGSALGLVRAKTGSLRGTSALAGSVLDADGRLLLFAVLADRTPSTGGARDVLDRFAATTAACGC